MSLKLIEKLAPILIALLQALVKILEKETSEDKEKLVADLNDVCCDQGLSVEQTEAILGVV